MRWPGIEQLYGPTLRQSPVFAPGSQLGKKTGTKASEKKSEEVDSPGQARWDELHKRVIEHVGGVLLVTARLTSTAVRSLRKQSDFAQ